MRRRVPFPALFRGPIGTGRVESITRCVPAALYLALIHAISSIPGRNLPSVIDDRVAHFLEYFVLGILLHLAMAGFDRVGRPWRVVVSVVSFAAVWGALDEFHQSFVPGRDSSAKDLAFDIAGALTATLLVRWFAWRKVTR